MVSSADRKRVAEAILQPPVIELLRASGWDAGGIASPIALLAKAREFSATAWNLRKGRERNEVTAGDLLLQVDSLILAAATSLGMRHPAPPNRSTYDHLLILGGLRNSCEERTRFAAQLRVRISDSVAALTADRALTEREGADATPELCTEADVMRSALEHYFHLTGVRSVEESSLFDEGHDLVSRVITFARRKAEPKYAVISAPSTSPHGRANTPDTMVYWRGGFRPQSSVSCS